MDRCHWPSDNEQLTGGKDTPSMHASAAEFPNSRTAPPGHRSRHRSRTPRPQARTRPSRHIRSILSVSWLAFPISTPATPANQVSLRVASGDPPWSICKTALITACSRPRLVSISRISTRPPGAATRWCPIRMNQIWNGPLQRPNRLFRPGP